MNNSEVTVSDEIPSEKTGYKKTKLGWIPKEWKVVRFKEAANFNPKAEKLPEKFIYIDLESVKNGRLRKENEIYKIEAPSRAQRLLQKGDILFQTVRPYQKNNLFFKSSGDYVASSGYTQIRAKEFNGFIYHLIYAQYINNQVMARCTGTSFPAISAKDLSKIYIKFPPLPEQQKIAQILTTWDKAIAAEEKLIAQKQKLKNGLIQQLLTGKKRLPEFTNKWMKMELKEIGTIIRGASPRPKGDPRFYGGNVPRLMVKDVTRDGKYVTPKIDFLTEAGAKKSRPCKAGTLTIVCSGDVGVPSILAVDACIHDGFLAIIDIKSNLIEADFLYYQLKRLKARIERSATHGGVFTNLTTTILKDFIIEVPPKSEQIKIVNILSKADKESDQLEVNLKQLILQKQGLMQQLLTGEKRVKI
ncbi:restriction endonuclease subunit S [Salegentibacter agarivorans]